MWYAWLAFALIVGCESGHHESPTPDRIVSLVPAATEVIAALGEADRVVGRTAEDDFTAASVGNVLDPSIERIVALEPDLVIAWADAPAVVDRLQKAGLRVHAVRFDRLADASANVRAIGEMLGVAAKADSLANIVEADLKRISDEHHRKKPRVLYLLDTDPLWTAGPNTFVNDLIEVAGGRNIFDDLHTPWSQVSLEAVIVRQPDVIVVAQPAHKRHAGLRLRGVTTKHIYYVASDAFYSPSVDVADNARMLARLLHQPD